MDTIVSRSLTQRLVCVIAPWLLAFLVGLAGGSAVVAVDWMRHHSRWLVQVSVPIEGWERRSLSQALRALHAGAERNEAEALYVLGQWHLSGYADLHPIGADTEQGLGYLHRAAILNHQPAILEWGAYHVRRGAVVELQDSWVPIINQAHNTEGDSSAAIIMAASPHRFDLSEEDALTVLSDAATPSPKHLPYASLLQAKEWELLVLPTTKIGRGGGNE